LTKTIDEYFGEPYAKGLADWVWLVATKLQPSMHFGKHVYGHASSRVSYTEMTS